MVAKRKGKRPTQGREDLSKPSKWRLQHGNFTAPGFDADPETGAVVVHRRAVDTLGAMLANGSITHEMHDAGQLLRGLFRSATFDSMSTSQLIRVARDSGVGLSERQMEARRRIAAALDALGGQDGSAASCAWFVIGLEYSVREWAMRHGWAGRTLAPAVANGILVATLTVLAGHFGLMRRPAAA